MAIHDTQRLSLCDALRSLKTRFFPGWQVREWRDTEIKGRYLAQSVRLQSKGSVLAEPADYSELSDGQVSRLLDSLFNLIHRFRPVFYFVAVNKQSMMGKFSPETQSCIGLAYAYLQIRAALLVDKVYGKDEGAVFLADEHSQHEGLYRSGEMALIREEVRARTHEPANIDLVLEKPIWLNKGEMPVDREIAQLVDFALYVVGTAFERNRLNHDNQWLRRLSPYIARHWTKGDVWDGGITIVPRPYRYPEFPFS